MTLILGLKTRDCVVVGAEQEETAGTLAKRAVTKLRLITGSDWAVVVGGAGDAAIAENAMREMERKLEGRRTLNEEMLLDVTDKVLDSVHTKYIDKDQNSEGISLVIGAVCGDQLYLISTAKRVPQVQDSMAYAGWGTDIGIFFMDRLHHADSDWVYAVTVAGFTLQQAKEACRFCSGGTEIYALQRPPNPRWRSLGTEDASIDFFNSFQSYEVAKHLERLLRKERLMPESQDGYRDEHYPERYHNDFSAREFRGVIPLQFFPENWLESPAYQKQIDETCSHNRDTLLRSRLLNRPLFPPHQEPKK